MGISKSKLVELVDIYRIIYQNNLELSNIFRILVLDKVIREYDSEKFILNQKTQSI